MNKIEKPKTIKVRIAVAVDSEGSWNSAGADYIEEKDLQGYVTDSLEHGERHYWLEAILDIPDSHQNLEEPLVITVEATPEGEGRPVGKEKLCKEMLECLEWYIQEDDTIRGNCTEDGGPNWDEENEYWIKGQDKALDVCARARLGLGLTPKMEK